MTPDANVDRILDDWFTDGPTHLPDHAVAAIADRLGDMPRHARFRSIGRGRIEVRRLGLVAAVIAVIAASALVVTNLPRTAQGPAAPLPKAVFTEVAPGTFVDIPDSPLGELVSPTAVWTGTELIVLGDDHTDAVESAAFDLAKGTWHVIAEAPLSPRSGQALAWTGTEMLVWGGRVDDTFYYDGAAYDPATAVWRRLAPAPGLFFGRDPVMVWTGQEAVVLGVTGDSETIGEYTGGAAYDPKTDEWRTLADSPISVYARPGNVWSTGDSIVAADVGIGGGATNPAPGRLARYDFAADRWTVADIGPAAAVVGVTGSDGRASTFIELPSEIGAPVRVIDGAGRPLADLPAFPGDSDVFGDLVEAHGLWVGDEAVFEIWKVAEIGVDAPQQIWALNPNTRTWRRLDADTQFPRVDPAVVVAGDLLFLSNRPGDVYRGSPRMCCAAPPSKGGSIYRVGTADTNR
jgi:hypothetical protein